MSSVDCVARGEGENGRYEKLDCAESSRDDSYEDDYISIGESRSGLNAVGLDLAWRIFFILHRLFDRSLRVHGRFAILDYRSSPIVNRVGKYLIGIVKIFR